MKRLKKHGEQPGPQAKGKRFSTVQWLEVASEHEGQRIDNYLMAFLRGLPRSRIYQMLRKGEVRVNGGRVRPSARLAPGDQVRVPPIEVRHSAQEARISPALQDKIVRSVCHEDAELAVLDKPTGVAVHSGSTTPTGLIEALSTARPGIDWGLAHRLDRGTSGCLVVGKGRKATRQLQGAFRTEQVSKVYLVLVVGCWSGREYRVDTPLRQGPWRRGQRVVVADSEGGRAAGTRFKPLRRFSKYTLMRVEPKTGRTHQIRAHAQIRGFPVAGDPIYGDPQAEQHLRRLGLDRIFLHSAEVEFPHPTSGEWIHVQTELPEELKGFLHKLAKG